MEFDTRLGAYAVIVDDRDRVLLVLWNEADTPRWAMPGGGAELGETVPETAIREVKEETGYDVELTDLLAVDSFDIPAERRIHGNRPLKAVRIIYTARIRGGDLRHEVDGTTDEARWFPLSEVPALDRVELVDLSLDAWRAVVAR